MKQFLFPAALFAVLGFLHSAQAETPAASTPEQRAEVVKHLDWKEGGEFALPDSESKITVDKKYGVLLGQAARTFMETTNGTRVESNIEALIIDTGDHGGGAEFKYIKEGFVSLDDWDDVNPDRMLKEMTEGNEQANKERTAHGIEAIHVKGWGSAPHLDRETKTVHWSVIAATEHGESVVNAVALKLGRHGYEQITGMGENEAEASAILKTAMDSFQYQPGAAYGDFKKGDKVAEYGIAALVAAGVGAKVAAKFGLLAVLLVFLKKAWVLLLLIPALFKRGIRKFMGKDTPGVQPTEPAVAATPEPPQS